eukprot:765655-Hanusia_phi.AAC.2
MKSFGLQARCMSSDPIAIPKVAPEGGGGSEAEADQVDNVYPVANFKEEIRRREKVEAFCLSSVVDHVATSRWQLPGSRTLSTRWR